MSLVEIKPLVFRDACYVAANIREEDWDECRCQLEEENKFVLAQLCFFGTSEELRWCALYRGQPVTAFGVISSGPCVYNLWLWSTPRLIKVFPAIVKYLDVELRDRLIRLGARRLEIRAYEKHDFVQRGWLEKAGALPVCELPQYGKNGECFRLYAWWRGMPNDQDVRRGYDRIRHRSPRDVVHSRSENRQLSDDGSLYYGDGRRLLVHGVPGRDDRRGRADDSVGPAVEFRPNDDLHRPRSASFDS